MAKKVLLRSPRRPTLRRYTDLAAVIHILQTRTITLLDPAKWDDGNDRYALEEYKRRTAAKTLLALCFAETGETYHHWRVFAPGISGICIEFLKEPLTASFDQNTNLRHRSVSYPQLALIPKGPPWLLENLPFTKRYPYRPEKEYRVIYSSNSEEKSALDLPIEISWIYRIVLSPWMPPALRDSVITALRNIEGCERLTVQTTSLIRSETWRRYIERSK